MRYRFRAVLMALAGAASLVLACGRRAPAGESPRAAVAPRPAFPAASVYRPPADGALTDEQIDRFLRVRRASKGRTDADSARALGMSPEEIAWVRGRIVEALVALDDRRIREATAESYGKAIGALRAGRAATHDAERSRSLDADIAALERERAAVRREETPTSAIAANMRRVARRRSEVDAVPP